MRRRNGPHYDITRTDILPVPVARRPFVKDPHTTLTLTGASISDDESTTHTSQRAGLADNTNDPTPTRELTKTGSDNQRSGEREQSQSKGNGKTQIGACITFA